MLSIPDMAIIGAAALIFFGPDQLPKVARKVGLFMRDVQNTSQSFIREMERAADDPGTDVSRSHIFDEPATTYGHETAPAWESPAYGAYEGGALASGASAAIPQDEANAARADTHAELQLGMFDPPAAEPLPFAPAEYGEVPPAPAPAHLPEHQPAP